MKIKEIEKILKNEITLETTKSGIIKILEGIDFIKSVTFENFDVYVNSIAEYVYEFLFSLKFKDNTNSDLNVIINYIGNEMELKIF